MVDHSAMRLGKLPAVYNPIVPRMAAYLTPALPPPPPTVTWSSKLSTIGMMRNDQLGCCTCAAVGHAIQTTSSWNGAEITMPDDQVVTLYEQFGYRPGDESTDRGAVEDDVLAYWLKNAVDSVPLLGRTDVHAHHHEEVMQSIFLLGGLYIGVDLPVSAQTQDLWDVVDGDKGDPGSWGGHAVWVCDYDHDTLTCVTWGALKKMTWGFWDEYCDEAHGLLIGSWVSQRDAPSGFNRDQLLEDMKALVS